MAKSNLKPKHTLLDEIYRTSQDVKEVFLMAREEVEETGNVSPEVQEAINQVCRDRNAVCSDLGDWYQHTLAEYEGLEAKYKPIIERMNADLKELDKRMDFIKWCMKQVLPPSKEAQIANERAYVYYRESKVLIIDDEDSVPLEFKEVITRVKAADVKECIASGATVPGAHVEYNYSPQIKPGGVKAMRSAEKRLKKILAGQEACE